MSTRAHTIRIADSGTVYRAIVGDNLLRAGLRAGIGLPYECNAGGCGSCKFELISGEIEEVWAEAPGLSAKDRTRGRRLACQCRAMSDCEIKIRPADSFLVPTLPAVFEAEYIGHRVVTPDIREFRFRSPAPARRTDRRLFGLFMVRREAAETGLITTRARQAKPRMTGLSWAVMRAGASRRAA